MAITIQQLADRVNATLVAGLGSDPAHVVTGCTSIDVAGPDDVTFLANQKYTRHLQTTRAAAVFIRPDEPRPDHITALVADDPYFAFRNALVELVGFRTHPPPIGCDVSREHPDGEDLVSPLAAVDATATIEPGAHIHPFAVVMAGAHVGSGSVLYPGVCVGERATIGRDCILHPNVTIYDRCVLGDRVILHSGTVVGQDGFGFATHDGVHHKIPQTGIAVIEDDVEMGAGCAIERATIGETRIGAGTKFADLISIGHGTTVGRGCLFVSLVGVSGSVQVGNYVVLGGQVGVTGHISIGDGVQAMARTAIPYDIEPGRIIGGVPAIDGATAKRNALVGTKLAELARRVRDLERQIEQSAE